MLSHTTSEEDVRALFGQFGPLSEVVLLREKESAVSKGSAFVKFHTREAAEAAIHTLDKRYKDKVRGRESMNTLSTTRLEDGRADLLLATHACAIAHLASH